MDVIEVREQEPAWAVGTHGKANGLINKRSNEWL